MFASIKAIAIMLTMGYITQLVTHQARRANLCIYITMRMSINPTINTRICYIVAQFHRKCSANRTSAELLRCTQVSRHMMGEDNLSDSLALSYCLFDKLQAAFVLMIEILSC